MKYHAFISYSHRDKAWGDWLHKSLEAYKVPKVLVGKPTSRGEPVPARVYPVFRDREELPTAVDLGSVITHALEESRYLIVICSPNSARSQWVNQEIINYKRLGRENRVLAIIVDGEPNAAEGKPGFTPEQECFPAALKFKLGPDGHLSTERTEPIAADARAHADGKPNALLKLLAGVLGVNYDDLKRRDEEARRRRQRVVVSVAAALTLVFASLAAVSVWQWRVATERRQIAEKRLYQSSVAFAYSSLKDGRATLARQALWRAPQSLRNWEWGYLIRQVYPSLASFVFPAAPGYLETWVSADRTRWSVHYRDKLVSLHAVPGQNLAPKEIPTTGLTFVDVSADGRRALICTDGKVTLWDLETATELKTLTADGEPEWQRAFFWDRAGSRWMAANEDDWRVRDLATGETLGNLSEPYVPTNLLAASSRGEALVFNNLGGRGGLLDASGRWVAPLDAALAGANFAAFSPDEQAAVFMTGDGGVWLLDRSVAQPQWQELRPQDEDLSARNRLDSRAAFSADGSKLWFISRKKFYAYERATAQLSELVLPGGFAPTQLAVADEQIAVGTDHGQLVFFTARGEQVVSEGLGHEGPVLGIAALPAGAGVGTGVEAGTGSSHARWASLGADGTLQFWGAAIDSADARLETIPGFAALPEGAKALREATVATLGVFTSTVEAAHQAAVDALAFDASGERLVSGGDDGHVRIWSAADRELLLTIKAPGDLVEETRFSADPLLLGVLANNYGANAYQLSIVWRAEDWRTHPWQPRPAPDTAEAAAYLAWKQREFMK